MNILSKKQIVLCSCISTLILELIFVLFRFGFGLESTRDTASTIGVLTFGIRIHHGYIGLLAVAISLLLFKSKPQIAQWLLIIGTTLFCSDLIHHFIVLWIFIGSPEFDFRY